MRSAETFMFTESVVTGDDEKAVRPRRPRGPTASITPATMPRMEVGTRPW